MIAFVLLWALTAVAGVALLALGVAAVSGLMTGLAKLVFVENHPQPCLEA